MYNDISNTSDDTIFALSSVMGKSGVAVIRISGIMALDTITYLKFTGKVENRIISYGNIYDQSHKLIDQVLILYFKSPNSFTGEDVIEIHTHGSIAIIKKLLHILSKKFRLAEPGEFSRRSFLNGKMDLTTAEGIEDLIEAESDTQANQALSLLSGKIAILYNKWRDQLIDISADLEAYIDFPDEDIPDKLTIKISNAISKLISDIENHIQDNRGEKIRNGIYIAIIGSPNAGKSTLLNHLVDRDAAIVSKIEGTTRDVIEVHMTLGGYSITLADTAGIRETEDYIESQGIERSLKCAERADIKLILFDIYNNKLDPEITHMIDDKSICLATKADYIDYNKKLSVYKEKYKMIPVSTYKDLGTNQLLQELKNKIENNFAQSDKPIYYVRERHKIHLMETLESLNRFDISIGIECASEELRYAVQNLGKITGIVKIDEILDKLFSKFCIGK